MNTLDEACRRKANELIRFAVYHGCGDAIMPSPQVMAELLALAAACTGDTRTTYKAWLRHYASDAAVKRNASGSG